MDCPLVIRCNYRLNRDTVCLRYGWFQPSSVLIFYNFFSGLKAGTTWACRVVSMKNNKMRKILFTVVPLLISLYPKQNINMLLDSTNTCFIYCVAKINGVGCDQSYLRQPSYPCPQISKINLSLEKKCRRLQVRRKWSVYSSVLIACQTEVLLRSHDWSMLMNTFCASNSRHIELSFNAHACW